LRTFKSALGISADEIAVRVADVDDDRANAPTLFASGASLIGTNDRRYWAVADGNFVRTKRKE
jgi:hypothetical protein